MTVNTGGFAGGLEDQDEFMRHTVEQVLKNYTGKGNSAEVGNCAQDALVMLGDSSIFTSLDAIIKKLKEQSHVFDRCIKMLEGLTLL